jgi:hypothetical protein
MRRSSGGSMASMLQPGHTFRLVIQRIGDERRPSFRVVAYGEDGGCALTEFATLRALLDSLHATLPDLVLDLKAAGSIVFAGEMKLDDAQLRALRLV